MIHVDIDKMVSVKKGRRMHLKVKTEINEGDFISLSGPSGAGKTTLLKTIAGLVKPDFGRITINGNQCFDSDRNINLHCCRRKVGYLFQEYALFPNMTLRQNILYGCRDARLVDQYIDNAGLARVRNSYPSTLSGGEKQRCALLRSALNRPNVLLLDEPFSAIDIENRTALYSLLKTLQEEMKFTVIMVSHDWDEICALSNRVIEMADGRVSGERAIGNVFYICNEKNRKFRIVQNNNQEVLS